MTNDLIYELKAEVAQARNVLKRRNIFPTSDEIFAWILNNYLCRLPYGFY